MSCKNPLILVVAALFLFQGSCEKNGDQAVVMFYNVENLFDTINDPRTNDDEFTPEGEKTWSGERYRKKLKDLGKVIATAHTTLPDILGLCEVENRQVVEDLISEHGLSAIEYGIIHKDSPDKRGIDVAAVYNNSSYTLEQAKWYEIELEDSSRPQTRDVLYFKGKLKGQLLHTFVCHWPSRSGGAEASEHKRVQVATLVRNKVDSIYSTEPSASILIMGDLNDYPTNRSVQETLGAKGNTHETQLVDLFLEAHEAGKGTYNYKGEWGVLDHFIVSRSMIQDNCQLCTGASSAQFIRRDWMMYEDKAYGSKPSRTYAGPNYTGGFSDHLPILLELEIK